jgi:hypothetical protein
MANQLIGGLGTLGSLYGAYGGFTDAGFGSALPGYGPVNQKEGSGATTILPRQNAGTANPYDPRYDMSFEDPNMIGEVEQNRLIESQRLQQLELMSDPSVLENQYRAAMIIVNGGTPEEVMLSQQIMRGATELGVDMQALIDEVRASNREEAAIDRQEFIQGIGDKVSGGLQSLQKVLGARQGRAEGGPVIKRFPGGIIKQLNSERGLSPVRQLLTKSLPEPTPVAVETTQPNTQLLPSDTTNRVDPRRQPPYTGVIGTGGLVDITDDGLQVFQKTQQGILNRSLYGGVLESGNPALAATPGEETTPTPAAPMSSTIAGMLEKSPLVTTDTSSAPSVLPKDLSGVDNAALSPLLSMPSVQARGGVYNASEIRDAGIDLNRPSDAPETIISSGGSQTKYRDPQTGLIPYDLYVRQPVNTFGQGYDLKDMDYFTANALALSEGADRFMYNNEYAAVDPGLLSNYNYSKLGTKPYRAPTKLPGVSYSGVMTGRSTSYANAPQNPNSPAALRARGYEFPGRGLPPVFTGIKPYTPQTRSSGGQIISRKGGGLVDLPVVKRQQNAAVLSPADQALVNTFNNSNNAAERAEIRNKLKGKIDLGYNLRDRGSIFTGINNTMNSIFDTVTKLEIPDNIAEEVRRVLFEENYNVNNLDEMENNVKKIINANTNPAFGYVDSISGANQQQAIENQDTPPIQVYERGKELVNIGIDTAISKGNYLASLLTSSKNNIKDKEEEDKSDNKIITENKEEIIKPQLEANNTALSLLDEFKLLNPARDSSLLGFENKLKDALNKSKNKNAAVVKAIKAQDKRIKDRIDQAPEAIRMEIFARMAQGFASMATSASPPVQAFLEEIPSFVEDTTAIGRAQRERVENLEDLAVESARAEAALADSEFTQATSMAAFGLDKEAIAQKREEAFAELAAKKYGLEAYLDADKYVNNFVQFQKGSVYGNARRKIIEFVLENGPGALNEDVVKTFLNQNEQQDIEEKKSILDKIKDVVK